MGIAPSVLAPYGAQTALVNTDLICLRQTSVENGGGYVGQNITASITAPLAGGSGQQVYFSDLAGTISIPDDLLRLASSFSATHYQISYTATFDTTDQSNSRALAQSAWAISGYVWKPISEPVVSIPTSGGVYKPLGPVTLGVQGSVTDFRVSNLTYSFYFANQNNESISPLFDVNCGRTQLFGDNYPRFILASTVVDDSPVSSTPLAPANGLAGTFPPTGFREKSTNANLNVSCSSEAFGAMPPKDYRLSVTGTGPAILFGGQKFSLKNWSHIFTLPQGLFYILMTRGLHGFGFTTDSQPNGDDIPGPGLGLTLSNASPSQIDVAREFNASYPDTNSPLFSGRYVFVENFKYENLTFPLPFQGDLSLGPITAGESFKVTGATVNNLQGNLFIYDFSQNKGIGNLNFRCTVKANALLRTALYL